MYILICGCHQKCGFNTIEELIKKIKNDFNIKYEIHIDKSTDFFSTYKKLTSLHYDHIILTRRNLLDITKTKQTLSKYIEIYNCWSLFANTIIGSEEIYNDKYVKILSLFSDKYSDNNNTKISAFFRSNNYGFNSFEMIDQNNI